MGLFLTLMHSEQPKLHRVLAVLSAIGLKEGGGGGTKYNPKEKTPYEKGAK